MVPDAAFASTGAAACQNGQITSGYQVQSLEVRQGLLAHAIVQVTFIVPPAAVISVLKAPHELHVTRQTLQSEPGLEVITVTMKGDFRILMKRKEFEQAMRMEADCRDPERFIFHHEILQSEVMHVQTGHWELTPIRGANGQVEGTSGVYELLAQARVPAVVRRLPMAKKTTHRATLSVLKDYIEHQLVETEAIGLGLSLEKARERIALTTAARHDCSDAQDIKLVPYKASDTAVQGSDSKGMARTPTRVRAFLLDDIGDDEESEGSSDAHEEQEALSQLVQ